MSRVKVGESVAQSEVHKALSTERPTIVPIDRVRSVGEFPCWRVGDVGNFKVLYNHESLGSIFDTVENAVTIQEGRSRP